MKNKLLIWVALVLAASWLAPSCETDMEKAQNDYTADQVIPIVIGTSGETLALQTFTYTYKVTYDRAGSTWAWTVTDATIQSTSEDTKSITVLFGTKPANDTALIKVVETTSGGVVSPQKVIKVKVKPFCPLAVSDFVGTWGGTDGATGFLYPSEVVTSAPSGSTIQVTGLNYGWMLDYWGETVTAGGTITMTINNDGTLTIADQYCFTTDYEGDPYVYWIKNGTGKWDGCGATPAMTFTYNVYYKDGTSSSINTKVFTATLVMD